MTLLVARDSDKLQLAWLPAVDDETATEEITYDIHLSQVPGFEPTAESLFASVVGSTQTVLSGLVADTTYQVLVVAKDRNDRESFERDYRSITTSAFPAVLSQTTPLELAKDLGLGEPVAADGATLVFSRKATSVPPRIGAVLIGSLGEGRGYVRRVEKVTLTLEDITVETSAASIRTAADQLHLASNASLSGGSSAVAAQSSSYAFSGGSAPGVEVEDLTLKDGTRYRRHRWRGGLLNIERIDYAGKKAGLRFRPGSRFGTHEVGFKDHHFGGLRLDLGLDFQPQLVTDAKWSLPGGVRSAELIARGTLRFDAVAEYAFTFASTVSPAPIPLFTTTWTAVYSAGPVPVYQQITLDVEARVSASASAAIHATAGASVSAGVEVGVRYDASSGWVPFTSFDHDRSLAADLDVVGAVEAEVRLVPRVSVEFYEVIAGRISVEPSVGGTIQAEATATPVCAPIELTAFNFDLEVDCFVGVDFNFFGTYPLFESQVCDPAPWILFSLPQLELTASGNGPVHLSALVTDGAANPFDPGSAAWTVSPATGQIASLPSAPLSATLDCAANDTYTVTFSGHGRLGPVARRCIRLDVSCGPPCVATASREYVISGGPDPGAGIFVDDILRVWVNETKVAEQYGCCPAAAPVRFVASTGDILRVQAQDANNCYSLDPLYLQKADGTCLRQLNQQISGPNCGSEPPEQVFFDRTFILP